MSEVDEGGPSKDPLPIAPITISKVTFRCYERDEWGPGSPGKRSRLQEWRSEDGQMAVGRIRGMSTYYVRGLEPRFFHTLDNAMRAAVKAFRKKLGE